MDVFTVAERISRRLALVNACNDFQRTLRILKVQEEAGEAAEAWIGYLGQNPRKGVTHTAEQVADELADIVVTALVAIEGLGQNSRAVVTERAVTLFGRMPG